MIKRKTNSEIIIWSIAVLIISILSYLPMLLDRLGFSFMSMFLNAKNIFVLSPFVVSLFFVIKEHKLKQWFFSLFSWKQFNIGVLLSLAFAAAGIALTFIYSLAAGKPGVFSEHYPAFLPALKSCLYLFATAFIEEIAWRGFLLNKLSVERKAIRYTVLSGVIWGIWHIPMQSIRNMLGIWEISLQFIWILLLAIILGNIFYKYRNVLLCALLHAIFNLCFLAPVSWNIVVMALILFIAAGVAWKKNLIKW